MTANVHTAESIPARARVSVAIVGAGPAGLFAAEHLAKAGLEVTIYERMPSPARKFLMAGRGGLNLTHSEDLAKFIGRYHDANGLIARAVLAYRPAELIAWANSLGAETFVGSSGRVFPKAMKASPLLRAWLRRLGELNVVLRTNWTWRGFAGAPGQLAFDTPRGPQIIKADAVLLALGGASWPRLGSDGRWVSILQDAGVNISPLRPSNSGVLVPWSAHIAKHAGSPIKRIAVTCGAETKRGEAVITKSGLEGGAIYALAPHIRAALDAGCATLMVDLLPDTPLEELTRRLEKAPPKDSTANVLRKAAGLSPAAAALLRESGPLDRDLHRLAARVKAVSLSLTGLAGIERAISSAGGVASGAVDDTLMLRALPGVFVAGEMLDFDAPTGGYLLQEAFATASMAATGIQRWCTEKSLSESPPNAF